MLINYFKHCVVYTAKTLMLQTIFKYVFSSRSAKYSAFCRLLLGNSKKFSWFITPLSRCWRATPFHTHPQPSAPPIGPHFPDQSFVSDRAFYKHLCCNRSLLISSRLRSLCERSHPINLVMYSNSDASQSRTTRSAAHVVSSGG